MIFWDKKKYSILIKAIICRIKAWIVIVIVKNISCVTQVSRKIVDNKLDIVLKGNRSCNFYIIIIRLNDISLVFLKDSLIVFFWNTCKQILVIRAKNSSFKNL